MHPWQGKLYISHHIACAGCEAEDEIGSWIQHMTKQHATQAFVARGWVQSKGLWYCRDCAREKNKKE